ncbi:oligosaccharide flippase family protein [Pseudomonas saudiphocaensis]|uniref:oligosaccharide flippase family protein n=1 Tax=Pseudomonas saudiphocaensis TaxID=1499686 RepID=UPI000F791DE5|nr:oligosaccharide flippase family protein [Pseudomonas saudiphocaensis]RRV17551.1 translocase [Pseudomonas saudiphocaensis]
MLNNLRREKILKSPFLRRVSMLVGGTAIGQLIAIMALPILTRMYEPEAFSTLAVYVSVLSMLTAIAGLCFEYAIPLPRSDRVAAALCLVAMGSVLAFTTVTMLVIVAFPYTFKTIISDKMHSFLWLIPVGVFFVGMYNALQYWGTRNKKFTLIAKTRVTQSLSGTVVKLGAGHFYSGSVFGLVLGQLIAQGAGFITLGLSLLRNDWKVFNKLRYKHFLHAVSRYKNFPKFTTLEVFSNIGGMQIPVILIAYYSVGAEVGYLMIAMQLLSAPMGMLSGAVAQVYLAEAADKHHRGQLNEFTKKTITSLAKVSAIPLLLAGVMAPFLVPLLLGDPWQRTGILISWMVPWFFVQFITSPVSTILYITENQRIAFVLQIMGLAIRVGFVVFAAYYTNNLIGEFYAVSGFIFYLLYFVVVLRVLKSV